MRSFLLAVVALLFLASPAPAQMPCTGYEQAREALMKVKELPIVRVTADNGLVFEIWVSKDGKSWSIVGIKPDGMACLINAGSKAEVLTPDYSTLLPRS